ncbi:rac GTPase-activating protein 1 [Periplaneta americana]|uniref:rac GTPase-activating protein 1 n=1 Tax=Periplaneta americana TaxID=6978 RepID=UPI0037E891B9
MPLSLLAEYDELMRCSKILLESGCESEFHRFAVNQEECRKKWFAAVVECRRLQEELEKSNQNVSSLEGKLYHARRIIDKERKKHQEAETYVASLEKKLNLVRELVFVEGGGKINDETKEKLGFLNTTGNSFAAHDDARGNDRGSRLNTISEALDSTGSLLTDLSYSRSEDDLDSTLTRSGKRWRKHRPSLPPNDEQSSAKKRRSGVEKAIQLDGGDSNAQTVVATTTLTVGKEGVPIKASAKLEAIPNDNLHHNGGVPYTPLRPTAPVESTESEDSVWGPSKMNVRTPRNTQRTEISPNVGVFSLGMNNKINSRIHAFFNKTVIYPENCGPCGKRMKFGKVAVRCRDCRASCHPECKDQVPLPCVPVGNTPTRRGGAMGCIADYTPPTAPMVPSIIVHCVNEIELRGLNEVGIYRVPGAERDVKGLKEKFLRGKGVPNLSKVDIHVICGAIKDFLRSLSEPLVTHSLWQDFVKAAENVYAEDGRAAMYQAVCELPQPNRDTLAYLIMHLQRVAECPECKMPAENLAKVFGPTIVGYSTMDPEPMVMLHETKKQVAVVELLMSISSDYWANFVNADTGSVNTVPSEIFLTPSTECLLPRSGSSKTIFTPSSRSFSARGKRFFATPPAIK